MSVRKMLLAASALSLISLAVPAGADYAGVNTQFAGSVTASTEDVVDVSGDDSEIGSLELAGKCAYVGVTTLTGGIQFVIGGAATSYSTVPLSVQPVGTRVTCTLRSPAQGIPGEEGPLSHSTEIRMAGAAAVTTPAQTVPWPLRPVQICVSGDAQYGPAPAEEFLAEVCTTSAIVSGG